MKRKQRLTKAEGLLVDLLYRIQESRSRKGFVEVLESEIGPNRSNPIRNAALYLGERGWCFHFPEFGVEHGQDANRAGV